MTVSNAVGYPRLPYVADKYVLGTGSPGSWSSNWNTDRIANCIFNGAAKGHLNPDLNFQKLKLGQKNSVTGLPEKEGLSWLELSEFLKKD